MRMLLLEWWILHENVPSFPLNDIMRYLHRFYDVTTVLLDNLDFGKNVRRRRRYSLLTLRTVVSVGRPLSDVKERFGRRRDPSFTWRHLLTASKAELYSEILWARSRANVASPKRRLDQENITSDDFFDSLLKSEKDNMHRFKTSTVRDNARSVIALAHNPEWCNVSSGEELLHTLVRQIHLQWCVEVGRWLTVRELLLAQSIPTTTSTLAAALGVHETLTDQLEPVSSFNISRVQQGHPPRQRTAVGHMAGNTMDVCVVGTVMMHVLLELCCAVPSSAVPPGPLALCDRSEIETDTPTEVVMNSAADRWRSKRGRAPAGQLFRKLCGLPGSNGSASSTSADSVSDITSETMETQSCTCSIVTASNSLALWHSESEAPRFQHFRLPGSAPDRNAASALAVNPFLFV